MSSSCSQTQLVHWSWWEELIVNGVNKKRKYFSCSLASLLKSDPSFAKKKKYSFPIQTVSQVSLFKKNKNKKNSWSFMKSKYLMDTCILVIIVKDLKWNLLYCVTALLNSVKLIPQSNIHIDTKDINVNYDQNQPDPPCFPIIDFLPKRLYLLQMTQLPHMKREK